MKQEREHTTLLTMLVSIRHFSNGPYILGDTVVHSRVPHSWLPGDTVDPVSGKVLLRDMSKHRFIVGIVDFLNRTGQGFTPRGIPLYRFYPLDPAYPPMIVSSSSNPKQNTICVATMEHWNDIWPRAGIQNTLGPVGDKEVERNALLLRTSVSTKLPQATEHVPDLQHYTPFDGFACHIDPEGCEDVDDVLIWNGNTFGICIADVSAHVPDSSELDTYARTLGQTIYLDGKPIRPMLPLSVSHHSASLRSDGVRRPVLARMYTIEDGKVVSERWERLLVTVQNTFTYDTVYADKEVCSKLTGFLTAISGSDVGTDSHHWIELAMIHYNRAAATVLHRSGKGILRQHSGRTSEEWSVLAEKTGCTELAYFGYSSGMYVPAWSEHVEHAGLHLDVYCHASSPLRRYADLVNQRWLHHVLFQENEPSTANICTHLNQRSRVTKQLDRDIWFLDRLHTDRITEVRGIVLRTKADNVWTIYVPEWKRKIRGTSDSVYTVGDFVQVRAYTNLRATNWDNRLVCSCSPVPIENTPIE